MINFLINNNLIFVKFFKKDLLKTPEKRENFTKLIMEN